MCSQRLSQLSCFALTPGNIPRAASPRLPSLLQVLPSSGENPKECTRAETNASQQPTFLGESRKEGLGRNPTTPNTCMGSGVQNHSYTWDLYTWDMNPRSGFSHLPPEVLLLVRCDQGFKIQVREADTTILKG